MALKVVGVPEQIFKLPVMANVGVAVTVTVTTAVAVQTPFASAIE